MAERRPIYVMGDVHGQWEKLIGHLRSVGLIDERLEWSGEAAILWFLGDLFDRGPAGTDVLRLVLKLESEATAAGGQVGVLLGNHDAFILSVAKFQGDRRAGRIFTQNWIANGGLQADLERLRPVELERLSRFPALVKVADRLLAHADSTFYLDYGTDADSINQAICSVLQSSDPWDWERLLGGLSTRHAFDARGPGGSSAGVRRAREFLTHFSASRLVHGHTPIDGLIGTNPEEVLEAFVYSEGLCVNVDGGMYRGGPGFLYRLPEGRPEVGGCAHSQAQKAKRAGVGSGALSEEPPLPEQSSD